MNRYELGLSDPSTKILTTIAKELDVSTDYLLGLTDNPSGYKGGDLLPDERRLLDAYTLADGTTMFKLMYERLKQAENSPEPDKA